MKLPSDDPLLQGAKAMGVSKRCESRIVARNGDRASEGPVETVPIDDLARENISQTIIFNANQILRTIALCYHNLPSRPPAGMKLNEERDPLRLAVTGAVAKCRRAGVTVKMCTGDSILTARSIAAQCGTFYSVGVIMESPVFRELSNAERLQIVPRLQVLARSSPEDKKTLVETLKTIGEIVGITGDGTNDGPALKTVNVDFSMGIAGTEIAKEL
ncbi:hypothetical protein MD484_g313, partial [Candolleomyces efflorescens]